MTMPLPWSNNETGVLPVHLTPFAKDKAFGFRHSNLRDWVRAWGG